MASVPKQAEGGGGLEQVLEEALDSDYEPTAEGASAVAPLWDSRVLAPAPPIPRLYTTRRD